MSSLPLLLRTGRFLLLENSVLNVKTTSITRHPTYSSFRSIWSSLTRRKEAQAESQTDPSAQSAETDSPVKKEVDDLLKALQEMQQNRDEINDKYRRALAENENIRKRFQKQVEEAKLFGIQGFCKDLLDVADVLNKATECVPKEEVTDNNPHLKNLYEGLTMTESVLKTVFTRHGLEVINPIDEKFNPNFHEALFEQAVEGKPPGTVVVVSKTGYKLHERIIRPALVGVSK